MKPQNAFAVLAGIAVLVLAAVQLDHLLAGNIHQTPVILALAKTFSFIGNGVTLFTACALLYIAGHIRNDGLLKDAGRKSALALLLSTVFVHLMKASFERPRIGRGADAITHFLNFPSVFDLSGAYNSFPSGHASVSFAVAYVLSRKFPRAGVFFYAIAALIGASRVYLNAHYPTDVLAAAFLGVASGFLITSNTRIKERWITISLALLIIFMAFFKSGGFLLFDVDEAVFSEAAREMAETGDLITPTYNFEPRYDKPILIYWLMSGAFKLFGTTEFAARFTSGFSGTLLCLMTFFFVKRIRGLNAALFSTLALLLNLEFFVYSHSAVTDMTLALFITASIFSFYNGVREKEPRWFLGFWAASAFAVLTKGAIGLLFPVVISVLFLFLSKRMNLVKGLFRPSYIVLFILISAPWFIAEFMVNGWEFFNAFVIKHHIQRYSGVISSHGGPVYFYIGVLLLGFFPWVALLPAAVYKGLKERLSSDGLYLLCSVWFLFVLVFFSVAKTKLPNYIFPLFPPSAILAGLLMADSIEGARRFRSAYSMAALSAVFAIALFILPSTGVRMDVPFAPGFFYALGAAFAVIAALSAAARWRPLPSFIGVSALMLALIVFLRVSALPPVNIHLQKTLYDYSKYAGENLPADGVLATYEINKPSIPFYARKGFVKDETGACKIKEYAKTRPMVVITSPSKYEEIKGYNLKVLDSKDGYMLLATEDMPSFRPNK